MTDPFRVLLNSISAKLNEQEIRSLVLMCDVPEGLRAGMKDGITLFDNLIKRDVINERKLGNLKKVVKNLNPKRRDLIREIENFESRSSIQDDASSTLTSLVSISSTNTAIPSQPNMKEICCKVECPCVMILCYKYKGKIPWSYLVLTVFFLICFIILVLFWYADVPKVTKAITSDVHVKDAGPYILVVIVMVCFICSLLMCYVKKRRNNRSNYEIRMQELGEIQEEYRTQRRTRDVQEVKAISTSKIENDKASRNFGFSRYVNDEDILETASNP